MKKNFLVYFCAFFFLFSFSELKAQSVEFKGIFIDTFDDIVGNTAKEDSLLNYLKDSAYNSIICYQISTVVSSIPNSTKNINLASFLKRARTQFGIKNVLASSESYETFATLVSPYNLSRTDSLERFNYFYLEFEFWNPRSTSVKSSSNNGYYCTNYLSPKGYNCDTAGAFKYYKKMLKSIDSLAHKVGIRSATYVGKPNLGHAKFIANTVDLVFCDNYTANISSIYVNNITKLSYFASTSKTVQLVPIFASYSPDGPFLGDWLVKAPVGPHTEKGVYQYFYLPRFTAETAAWKSKINVIGYSWYRYSGMPHNGDYTAAAAVCSVPANLSATAITDAAALLNWATVSGAQSYSIQYRIAGTSTWTTASSTTNSLPISTLTFLSSYEFKVKAICSATKSSAYSSSVSFTTLALSCGVPTAITAQAASTSAISIYWVGLPSALSYSIQYKKSTSSSWSTLSTSATFINISSLSSATVYQYKVAMVCASGTSAYSSTGTVSTFSSTSSCGVPSGLSVSNLSTTSVTLNWVPVNGANSYSVQYRKVGTSSWTTKSSSFTNTVITSLTLNTNYECKVRTECNVGNSSYSSTFTFKTALVAARMNLSASVLNANSMDSLMELISLARENDLAVEFKIFPNPTNSSNIKLKIQLNHQDQVQLILYDMLGRSVLSEVVTTDENGFLEFVMNCPVELKAGIYQLMGYTLTQKLSCKLSLN